MAGYFIKTKLHQKVIIFGFLIGVFLNIIAIYFNYFFAYKTGIYINFDTPNYPTPIYHIQAAIIYTIFFSMCLLLCKESYRKKPLFLGRH